MKDITASNYTTKRHRTQLTSRRARAGCGMELASRLRVVLYVLSMDRWPFRRNRCMQRHIFSVYGMRDGWLTTARGQHLRIFYALDAGVTVSKMLEQETLANSDIVMLPSSQTCLGKVIACFRHAVTLGDIADAIAFTDDDAFVHPQRHLDDLNEHISRNHGSFAYYGQMSFAAGWNDTRQAHYGYANRAWQIAGKQVAAWHRDGSLQGPYPFAVMHNTALGIKLVHALVDALRTNPRLNQLVQDLHDKPSTYRCEPEPDSGLGYLIAQLRTLPIQYIDTSSTGRVHFWPNKATAKVLRDRLAILHKTLHWRADFRWAACVSSVHPDPVEKRPEVPFCAAASTWFKRMYKFEKLSCSRSGDANACNPAIFDTMFPRSDMIWCGSHDETKPGRAALKMRLTPRSSALPIPPSFCNTSLPAVCMNRSLSA